MEFKTRFLLRVAILFLTISYGIHANLLNAEEDTRTTSVHLSGVVVDSKGKTPVVGAKISQTESDITTYTDSDGRFAIELNSASPTHLFVDHRDYVFLKTRAFLPQTLDNTATIEVRRKIKSAATRRWESYLAADSPKLDFKPKPNWSVKFKQKKLKGDFKPDPDIVRRDPSAVLKIDGKYHVWYSRGVGDVAGFGSSDPEAKVFPWDKCDIYHATSPDGITWKEHGPAVERGVKGSFDDRSVFTPEVLQHEGKYYLVYQAVKAPYIERVKNTIGMAWAESPEGPWIKLEQPILEATHNGIWAPNSSRRLDVIKKGDFDSHKVHDPTLLHFNDKFYLYYKGERMGEERYFGQREIKWGVAIADNIFGPYEKSEYNPITNTGHELVLWKYNDGIALINTLDGPERGTVQFAKDGLNFEIMGKAKRLPHAQGLYRDGGNQNNLNPLDGAGWGLSHVLVFDGRPWGWMYINRFEAAKIH